MYSYLDIVSGFSCEMCGKCCRNDWLITVDEASYQRNERFFAAQGKQTEFQQAFVPLTTDSHGLGEYAYIAKGPEGGCCFLDAENFCHLHRQAGHEHLDQVCQTFPRYPMSTARGVEITLTFNCPAVFARINRIAPLAIVRSEQAPYLVNPESVAIHVFPQQHATSNPLYYYFELEQHFIDIIQWRSLKIGERLGLLRQTIDQINALTTMDAVGQSLNRIFYKNYEFLDAQGQAEGEVTEVIPEILFEHFLVNLIFQKNFYSYGLAKGMDLLEDFWRRLQHTALDGKNPLEDNESMKVMIMDMAFQHNHHRSR